MHVTCHVNVHKSCTLVLDFGRLSSCHFNITDICSLLTAWSQLPVLERSMANNLILSLPLLKNFFPSLATLLCSFFHSISSRCTPHYTADEIMLISLTQFLRYRFSTYVYVHVRKCFKHRYICNCTCTRMSIFGHLSAFF